MRARKNHARGRKASGQLGCSKDKIVAYCKLHRCNMSVRQMKNRQCLQKICRHLRKREQHPYWEQQARKHEARKARKEGENGKT